MSFLKTFAKQKFRETIKIYEESNSPMKIQLSFILYAGKLNRPAAMLCRQLAKGTRGIRDMYPSNDWFFLHCSEDGPWCKPCSERSLVYNAKCGQCETTRDGPCTGPGNFLKFLGVLSGICLVYFAQNQKTIFALNYKKCHSIKDVFHYRNFQAGGTFYAFSLVTRDVIFLYRPMRKQHQNLLRILIGYT